MNYSALDSIELKTDYWHQESYKLDYMYIYVL